MYWAPLYVDQDVIIITDNCNYNVISERCCQNIKVHYSEHNYHDIFVVFYLVITMIFIMVVMIMIVFSFAI